MWPRGFAERPHGPDGADLRRLAGGNWAKKALVEEYSASARIQTTRVLMEIFRQADAAPIEPSPFSVMILNHAFEATVVGQGFSQAREQLLQWTEPATGAQSVRLGFPRSLDAPPAGRAISSSAPARI